MLKKRINGEFPQVYSLQGKTRNHSLHPIKFAHHILSNWDPLVFIHVDNTFFKKFGSIAAMTGWKAASSIVVGW